MGDPNVSQASLSTRQNRQLRPRRRGVEEAESGDHSIACTGKSCQSCTAGAIADCVAVCCCPCAVVSLLALAFVKLPWAMARRCVQRVRAKQKKRIVEEERKWDMDGILGKERACEGISGIAVEEGAGGKMCVGFEIEEIWYEVGHLGFGRVSFTGASDLNH